jgi:uncharacterized protein (TIGR02246 family)
MTKTLLAVALLLLPACSRQASRANLDTESDKDAIRALLAEASAAHRAGDPERWTAVFTEDAVIMSPDRPAITGRQAVAQLGREQFARFKSTAEIKPVEIEVCGDWAFARTAVTGAFTPKDGSAPMKLDYKEIAIYRRQPDGTWKVARLIGNSNRPTSPPRATQAGR